MQCALYAQYVLSVDHADKCCKIGPSTFVNQYPPRLLTLVAKFSSMRL